MAIAVSVPVAIGVAVSVAAGAVTVAAVAIAVSVVVVIVPFAAVAPLDRRRHALHALVVREPVRWIRINRAALAEVFAGEMAANVFDDARRAKRRGVGEDDAQR